MPSLPADADSSSLPPGLGIALLSLVHHRRSQGQGITWLYSTAGLIARCLPEHRTIPPHVLDDIAVSLADLPLPGVLERRMVVDDNGADWYWQGTVRALDDHAGFLAEIDTWPISPEDHEFRATGPVLTAIPFPALLVRDGLVLAANPQASEIFTLGIPVGMALVSLMDEASAALFEQIARHLLTGAVRDVEANFCVAGAVRHCAVSVQPLVIEDTLYDVVILRDITVRTLEDKRLREGELRYRSLTENMRDVVWILDHDMRFTWISDPVQDVLGYSPARLTGRRLLEFITFGSRKAAASFEDSESLFRLVRSSQGRAMIELEFIRQQGAPVWLEVSVSEIHDDSLGIAGFLAVGRDIGERKMAQFQLGQSEEKFRKILERLPVPIIVMLHDWSVEKVNIKFTELFGWTREEIPHFEVWWERAFPDEAYRNEIRAQAMDVVGNAALNGRESLPFQIRVNCRDGEQRIVECRFIFLVGHGIWAFNDITELHRKEERLHRYATTDELTGIYNRRTGVAVLQRAIESCQSQNLPLSICYLDINNLKHANDTWGHGEGDALILLVVKAIDQVIRRSDTLCRMGGDEFLIIFPECDRQHAHLIIESINSIIATYNRDRLKPYTIGFSCGIEEYQGGQSLQEFVALADKSMYAEKRRFHRSELDSPRENSDQA